MKRRNFLKNAVVASVSGITIGAGLLSPNIVLAATNVDDAFEAKTVDEALEALGATNATTSDRIKIKAPEIAENGAVVPVSITSELAGTTDIISITVNNPTPVSAMYKIGEGTVPAVKTRFKMGTTTDVIVLVKANEKYYTAKTNVKVTRGGCGG